MTGLRIAITVILFALVPVGAVYAQTAGKMLDYPPKVDDIPGLVALKKQLDVELKYIGRKFSVDMWIARKDNISQIIYTTLDGRGLLTNGFLFDEKGNIVTEKQMADIQTDEPSIVEQHVKEMRGETDSLTPGERFWAALEKKNYISFGSETAPVMYVFADPYCPYCKKYWKSLESYVADGSLQVRIVPVGILGMSSADTAASLFGEIDKQGAWLKIVKGTYVPKKIKADDMNMAFVAENSIFMKEWEIESVPFSVYRNKFGKVKLLRGLSEDIKPVLEEMKK